MSGALVDVATHGPVSRIRIVFGDYPFNDGYLLVH